MGNFLTPDLIQQTNDLLAPNTLDALNEYNPEGERDSLKKIIKKEAKDSLLGLGIRKLHEVATDEPMEKTPDTKYTPWNENWARALLEHSVATGTNIVADALPFAAIEYATMGAATPALATLKGASMVGKGLEIAAEAPMLTKAAVHVAKWGAPMAAYEAIKNPIEQTMNGGEYRPLEHAKATGEGLVIGTGFGAGVKVLGKGIKALKTGIGERMPIHPSDVSLTDMNKTIEANNIIDRVLGQTKEVPVSDEALSIADKVANNLQNKVNLERTSAMNKLNAQIENNSGTQKGTLNVWDRLFSPIRATANKISRLTGADFSKLARHVNEVDGAANETLGKFGQAIVAPIDRFTKQTKLMPETVSENLQHLLSIIDNRGVLLSPETALESLADDSGKVPSYIMEAFNNLPKIKQEFGVNFPEAVNLAKGIRIKLNEMHNISKNTRIIEVDKVLSKFIDKLDPGIKEAVEANYKKAALSLKETGMSNLIESNSKLLEDLTAGLSTDDAQNIINNLQPKLSKIPSVTTKPNYIREMYDKSMWIPPKQVAEKIYQGSEGARELINSRLDAPESIFMRKTGDIPSEFRNKDIKEGLINYVRGFLNYNYQRPVLREASEVLGQVSSLKLASKEEVKAVSDAVNDAIKTMYDDRARGMFKGDVEENIRRLTIQNLPEMNPDKVLLIYNQIKKGAGKNFDKPLMALKGLIGSAENKLGFDESIVPGLQRTLLKDPTSQVNQVLGKEGQTVLDRVLGLNNTTVPENIKSLEGIKDVLLERLLNIKSDAQARNFIERAVQRGVDLGIPEPTVRAYMKGETVAGDFAVPPKVNITENMNKYIHDPENLNYKEIVHAENALRYLQTIKAPGAEEASQLFKELHRLGQENRITQLGDIIAQGIEASSNVLAQSGKIKVKTDMSEYVGDYIINAMRLNRPTTKLMDKSIVDSIEGVISSSSASGKATKSELSKFIGKNINADATWEQAWDGVLSQTYANLMGWRLTNLVRNFPFQVLLHHIPMTPATPVDSAKAFTKTMGNFSRMLFDKGYKEEVMTMLQKAGVIQDVTKGEGLNLEGTITKAGSTLGNIAKGVHKFNDVGTYLFGMTERFNRVLSYFYSHNLMDDVLRNNTGKTLERKVGDMLNPAILGETETLGMLNTLKTKGEAAFLKEYASAMSLKSQFSYNLASRSPLLTNKVARGALMFYKYPSEIAERYANYGRQIVKGNVRVPATALAKEMAAGGLVYVIGRELFNADVSDFAAPSGLSYSARTPLLSILVGMGDRPNKELAPHNALGRLLTGNTQTTQVNKVMKLISPLPAAYRTSMGVLGKDKARVARGTLKKHNNNDPNQSTFGSFMDRLLK